MKRQPQQQQSPLQALGINMDPMAQLSGLVNLINASQAPGIQQGQFQQEMGFKQMMGDRGYEHDQAQLDQHQQEVKQVQFNQDRNFDVQKEQNRISNEYNQGKLKDHGQAMQLASQDRERQMMMDFLQMFMHAGDQATGPGMVNMAIGNQLGQRMLNPSGQQGFPQLFDTKGQGQQAPYNSSNINQDLPDDKFREAYQKHTGR